MKTITPGHCYELENFERPQNPGQILQFIEKRPNVDQSGFYTVNDGTTNEEVLSVLIDRLTSINAKLPNAYTSAAITSCRAALSHLEARTAERKARNVEVTPKP